MKASDRLHNISEYYFSKKLREVNLLISQGKPVINMGVGSPDLAPPDKAIAALNEAAKAPKAHQYQSYQGISELREAFADFYKRNYGVSVNAHNEVLPLMGSKEGILHISMAFLNLGDEALIPNPGYPTYTSVTNLVGGKPRYYELCESQQWLPNLKDLEQQDLSRAKIMWINYPHMPTGSNINLEQLYELVNFARKKNLLLVNDNPYSFVLNDDPRSVLSIKDSKDVAIELNSLSKSFNMSGWRIGMVLGSAEHISHILKVKSNMDSGMYYGIQKGAIEALKSSQKWFDDMNAVYRERRDLIFELLNKLHCSYNLHSTGMFVWAKLPKGSKSSEDFIDDLLNLHYIFITPGTIFGSQGEGYIRLSLCVESTKIKEAINRI